MKISRYEDMNLQELDVMREIGSIGTSHAANAISRFIEKEVRITIPEVSILGYQEAVHRIGDIEELVSATLVQMSNEVEGLMLFIFRQDFANVLFETLLGHRVESLENLDELETSALEEIGNIIICSYINAFSQLVGMDIDLSVPSSTINMLGGIVTVPMVEGGYDTDRLLYINAEFIINGEALHDGLLMLPDIESLNRIMEKLGVS